MSSKNINLILRWSEGDEKLEAFGCLDDEPIDKKNKFDQMKFNEENFGLKDDFNESDYTTKLNMNEFTLEDIQKAERIAESIEKSELVISNRHTREERGLESLKDHDEDDEEGLYSAVVREDQAREASPETQNVAVKAPTPEFQLRYRRSLI